MMKNIFIVGARGYHAKYGGWETFVSNLVDNYDDKKVRFYVGELTDNKSQDKSFQKINNNIYVISIYVKNKGSAKMFFHTIKLYSFVLKYIKQNNLHNSYIYILGLKLGPFLAFHKQLRQKYNLKIYVNPDGLEHLRRKWNKLIQFCFLLSEKSMLKNSDLVVCDSLGIQKYVQTKYKNLKTTYIAYGTNHYNFKKIDETKILQEYHLTKDNYCLMVGRCVPENNYELVINDYMNSKLNKNLVIITNLSSSPYYQELLTKTNFSKDKRIIFIDGVYDQEKLATIRKNAYLYIHGHSVGGTNPSLVEALSLTDLNILYDVCFNHDIGLNTALYFKEKGSLTKLLDNKKNLDQAKKDLGVLAKKRVAENFTWEKIINQYKEIFK